METHLGLRRALVAHTYAPLPAVLAGSAIVSAGLAAVTSCADPGRMAFAWPIVQLLTHTANLGLWVWHRRGNFGGSPERSSRALRAGMVLFALGWGSAGLLWPTPAVVALVVAPLTAVLAGTAWLAVRNAAALRACRALRSEDAQRVAQAESAPEAAEAARTDAEEAMRVNAGAPPRAESIDEVERSAAIAVAEREEGAPAPAVAEVTHDAGPSGALVAAPEPARGRARRVLLVEDDDLVREAVACLFEADGFCVTAVGSADRAVEELARLEADGRRPDLLVTDHRLPGALTGAALVDKVRAAESPLPAILMSGDVDAHFVRQAPPPGVAVLRKPVSGSALLAAVAKVLGSPASGR